MMQIKLTESAAKHVESMLAKRGRGIGLRLGTTQSGCTGFAYVIDYADSLTEEDLVFESHGVKVIVAKQYLKMLAGVEIDFTKSDAINQVFKINNPNVKDMCGCGESFNV